MRGQKKHNAEMYPCQHSRESLQITSTQQLPKARDVIIKGAKIAASSILLAFHTNLSLENWLHAVSTDSSVMVAKSD